MAKKDKSENSLFGSGVHSRPIDAQGIVAKSKRGKFGESWWADRWIGVLNNFGWGSRLDRGRTYARRGQTLSLDVQPGRVDAKVQGSRVQPYDVAILLPTLKPQTWEKVFDALAQKSIFAAKLLAGEMPHEIEEAFYAAGTWLFPKTELELGQQCSCPDTVRPCKHLAAVHFMVAEKFDEDPFLMFALRGKTKDEVVAALRSRRVGTAEPVANGASAPAKLEVAPEPVHLSPERFFVARGEHARAAPARGQRGRGARAREDHREAPARGARARVQGGQGSDQGRGEGREVVLSMTDTKARRGRPA